MPEWFRVRDKTSGHHYTVGVVNPDHHTVIDSPATDSSGEPLPPKYNVSPAPDAASTATSASGAADPTESAKKATKERKK